MIFCFINLIAGSKGGIKDWPAEVSEIEYISSIDQVFRLTNFQQFIKSMVDQYADIRLVSSSVSLDINTDPELLKLLIPPIPDHSENYHKEYRGTKGKSFAAEDIDLEEDVDLEVQIRTLTGDNRVTDQMIYHLVSVSQISQLTLMSLLKRNRLGSIILEKGLHMDYLIKHFTDPTASI